MSDEELREYFAGVHFRIEAAQLQIEAILEILYAAKITTKQEFLTRLEAVEEALEKQRDMLRRIVSPGGGEDPGSIQ